MFPENNSPWPLPEYRVALDQISKDDAILHGDLSRLRAMVAPSTTPVMHPAQFNGGLLGASARAWYGRPHKRDNGSARIDYHLPVADALVLESTNLLAAKPPTITLDETDIDNTKAWEALGGLTSSDLFAAEWWEAMRETSAHGWVYGRLVWDLTASDKPWVEWVDADKGIADFRYGRLSSITFWDVYHKNDREVYRLFQRHTPGRIDYRLYQGSHNNVGWPVPVTDIPETAHLADLIDNNSGVDTGIDELTAVIIRNIDRNHTWRHHPTLRYYGVSDVAKGGDIWLTIDQTWTDLQHERLAGRARLMVSELMLNTGAPGQGGYFDMWRDIFPLAPTGTVDSDSTIEPVQFDIRAQEYLQILDAAHRRAVDAVGLSPITVGMDAQASGDMTATEIRARSHRTISTHGGKARQARAGLSALITAWLKLDASLNNYTPPSRPVDVALIEPVEDTPLDTATRMQTLRAAQLASIDWAVRELHPEWTLDQVETEIDRIKAEARAGMPIDPFDIGFDQPVQGV